MWEDMCVDKSHGYLQAMEVLEAQERLASFTTHDWPNLKKAQREKLHRSLHRTAYPRTHSGEALNPQQLAQVLGAGRIVKGDTDGR